MAENKKSNDEEIITLISSLAIDLPTIITDYDYKSHNIDFVDIIKVVNGKYCNVCGEKNGVFQCSHCKVLCYCNKDHQRKDWSNHKSQCMILSHAHEDMLALKRLNIPKGVPLIKTTNPFPSLNVILNWYAVWYHLQCTLLNSDIFQNLMSELLSWPLILVNAICKFKLDHKDHLQVHVLGANNSYIKLGLFTYLLEFFPLPETEIFLIGPQLSYFMSPLCFKNAAGRFITVSCISDVFCQQYDNFGLPDLIIAYHPDMQDEDYDWKPTLLYIVSKEIPSVFTMCSKEEFNKILSLLGCELLNTNIIFKGCSPFPSMLKKYERKTWNEYKIKVMNSYWVGFLGDSFTTKEHGRDIFRSLSELCNLSFLELDNVVSPMNDQSFIELGKSLIPSLFQFQFSDALKSFNEGLKKYDTKDTSASVRLFEVAITKTKLPKSKIIMEDLKKEKEKCEKKMKSVLASSYLYLGLLAKRQSDMFNAIKETKKAIAVDHTFHLAYYNLGIIYQDIGDFNGMVDAFSNATKLSPKDSLSWNGLGDALYGKGQFLDAKNAYAHAEKLL